jgi:subtilisin family serine protease
MADTIGQLRRVLSSVPVVTAALARPGLPPDELRFTLELAAAGDLAGLRDRIERLLASDRFLLQSLEVGQASAGRFHVLRFPTLERVFPQQDLFDIGYGLADQLGLISAEPDLGIQVFRDPTPSQPGPVAEASVLSSLCWADGQAPEDPLWAVKLTKLDRAWKLGQGEGVLVGHPDTGITSHAELAGDMFDLERAADIMDGDSDPTDPLAPGTANPGHGTSTASVLASRSTGRIQGAAPAARVVPIRCIDDVKVFNTAPVAAAIAHAVEQGCHVISMSLGGIAGRAMHAAIRDAVASDVIVVAAAGNCVGLVVWPARYAEVIAAGGTGPTDLPWKGSSRGSRVALSAPAEFVWRADRASDGDPLDKVSASQGTSYATAMIAGAAAVWLSRHGRDEVIEEARRRGVTVAQLFTIAVKATARTPDDWDFDLGAGILDAEKLVNLALDAIPQGAVEATETDDGESELLLEQFGPGERDDTFPMDRFEAEISAVAVSQAKFDQQLSGLTVESKIEGTQPSRRLRDAVQGSIDPRLRRFGQTSTASVSRPQLPAPEIDVTGLKLALPSGTVPETALGADAIESARQYLQGDGGSELEEAVGKMVETTPAPSAERDFVLDSVRSFVDEMRTGVVRTPKGRLGLEALILLKGRPALRVRQGGVDEEDPRAEQWGAPIYMLKSGSRFKERMDAVGRIDLDGVHLGTGYVVGDCLVLTNRHVLQLIAYPTPQRNLPTQWILKDGQCCIDFAEEPSALTTASKFNILEVVQAGPLHINFEAIDLKKPDFALLRVEARSWSVNNALPVPLELSRTPGWMDPDKPVAIVGYPARQATLPRAPDGSVDRQGLDRLLALFGADYGTKFFSPGRMKVSPAEVPITSFHDATTLGGSSGSLVVTIDAPLRAVGLHFGGAWRSENYAHSLAQLLALGFLNLPGINWKP